MAIKKLAFLFIGLALTLTACSGNEAQTGDSFSSDDARKANELYMQCMQDAGVPVELHEGNVSYSAATIELGKEYERISQECWADLEAQGLIPQSETITEEDARKSYELNTKAYQCFEDLGYKQDPWVSYETFKDHYLYPEKYQYDNESSYDAPFFKIITEDTVLPTLEEQDKCWKQAESQ